MASDAKSTTAAGPNKAQAEFDKYAQRRREQAATGPEVAAAGSFPGGGLTWAVPLGVGMAPAFPSGPASGQGPGGAGLGDSVGGLTSSIGTTVRLGVDLLNAALFSGVKILGGFTGAYGHGHHEDCGCGSGYVCESCCEPSCCEPSCCEPDCCGCGGCHSGVGSCC